MTWYFRVLAVVLLLGGGLSSYALLAAEGDALSISALPQSIAVEAGADGAQEILIIAAPSNGQLVRSATLTPLTTPGIKATILEEPRAFPARDDLVWRLAITADGTVDGEELAQAFRLDYQIGNSDYTSTVAATVSVASPSEEGGTTPPVPPPPPATSPDTSSVTLSVSPEKISPFPGVNAGETVIVIAEPAAGTSLASATLVPLERPGVRVDGSAASERDLPSADALAWTYRISVDPDIGAEATQLFRLDFRADQPGAQRQIKTVSLSIAPRARPAASEIAKVALLHDFTSLFEKQPGRAYLRIENLTDSPLALMGAIFFRPSFIQARLASDEPVVIPPRGVRLADVKISVVPGGEDPFRVGEYNFGAVLSLKARTGIEVWTGEIVAENKITVAIPGLEDVQKLVEVPSFLLLPGVLVLGAFAILLQWWAAMTTLAAVTAARQQTADGFLSVKSPLFWIISVTISILIVSLIPSLLVGYRLRDVVIVWMGSIFIGALAFGLFAAVVKYLEWRKARVRFTVDDDPTKVLERLGRLGRDAKLPVADSAAGRVFQLGVYEADDKGRWAVPHAKVSAQRAGPEVDQYLADLQTAVDTDDPRRILAALQAGLAEPNPMVKIEWEGALEGPTPLDAKVFEKPDPAESFIKVG